MIRFKVPLASFFLTTALLASSDSVGFVNQEKPTKANETIKLPHSSDDLLRRYSGTSNIPPISISNNRTLIPVGDMLYMLDSKNHLVWKHSVEPNFLFDVAVDSKGIIYLAIFDGSVVAINDSGNEVWSKFMNGSANYTQLEPYHDGILAVISMESYRVSKGFDSEDTLVYWKNNKEEWRKEFPRNAELHVLGDRIMAVKAVKDGKEIKELR